MVMWGVYEWYFDFAQYDGSLRLDLFIIRPLAAIAWVSIPVLLVITYYQYPKDP